MTASEVGAYLYCAKAWHLERVLGVASSREARRQRSAGVARHDAHGARVTVLRTAGRTLALGAAALLALAAVLAVASLVLLSR